MADPKKPTTAALIECRVVGANYGKHLRGDIVKVTQREIDRTTTRDRKGNVLCRVLVSLEEERAKIESGGMQDADRARAEADRAKRDAWAKMDRDRAAVLDRERLERLERNRAELVGAEDKK